MSIIKHVTLQKIVAHDFRYDLRTYVYKYTLRTYNNCFSTTKMDVGEPLRVTLYVHYLSCYSYLQKIKVYLYGEKTAGSLHEYIRFHGAILVNFSWVKNMSPNFFFF